MHGNASASPPRWLRCYGCLSRWVGIPAAAFVRRAGWHACIYQFLKYNRISEFFNCRKRILARRPLSLQQFPFVTISERVTPNWQYRLTRLNFHSRSYEFLMVASCLCIHLRAFRRLYLREFQAGLNCQKNITPDIFVIREPLFFFFIREPHFFLFFFLPIPRLPLDSLS